MMCSVNWIELLQIGHMDVQYFRNGKFRSLDCVIFSDVTRFLFGMQISIWRIGGRSWINKLLRLTKIRKTVLRTVASLLRPRGVSKSVLLGVLFIARKIFCVRVSCMWLLVC